MITSILKKHNGHRDYWFPDVSEVNLYINPVIKKKYSIGCFEKESALLKKWKDFIPKGWYGFSFGEPLHPDWFSIIDEFLDYLLKLQTDGKINELEIHQIKLKFGGIRFYIGYKCNDSELQEFIDMQISKLESCLYDSKLIY